MNIRRFPTTRVPIAVIAVSWIASTTLAGQAPTGTATGTATAKPATKTAAKGWTAPRTPWGDPDLEGMWPGTDFVGVPLARPRSIGTRTELNDEEFAARL